MINLKYLTELKEKQDRKELEKSKLRLAKEEDDRKILENFRNRTIKSIKGFESEASGLLKEAKSIINNSVNARFDTAKKELKTTKAKLIVLNKKNQKFQKEFESHCAKFKIKTADQQALKAESTNSFLSAATEECLEAHLLLKYLSSGKIDSPKEEVFSNLDTYVGGLCDMCGELTRKARLNIIAGAESQKNIGKYYHDTKAVYEDLSIFAFSNRSGLRSKIENLKGYINNLENMLYDLRLKE